jgi:DNA-binding SARP family transcriptional activator/tetratricopeptide (TPR) repeat protein
MIDPAVPALRVAVPALRVAVPALRVGVLGPLRVWRREAEVDLGPVQQRVVLAVLALQAGRPVGRQQMINAVWGDTPPRNAVNLVQRHVSGLRRVLEPDRPGRAPSSVLTWTEAGYLLTLPPGALDLAEFERELARARTERAAGQLPEAADALHSALGLWRGPVCDGLSSPFLDAQADRLAESRVSVLEERIELDLATGGHAELVAELRDLVAQHPLRERLRGLLMLALYRAGRPADALTAFRDARRYLADELGVEPSAPLQELHQQILAADPALTAVGATPATARTDADMKITLRRPAPAQLPHQIPDFTGRDAELGRLDALVHQRSGGTGNAVVITVVTGTAGVGKSALAVYWAHRVRDLFPDGQLYVNLRGFGPAESAMEPAEAIHGFLDAFAVPSDRMPLDLDARAALYRTILADLRVLVVLDNAHDVDQIRPLLPGSPGCVVVITSRNKLTSLVTHNGAQPVELDLLPAAEARRMLSQRLGRDRVASEPESVDEIIQACAGLPLALAVAASNAVANYRLPLSALAGELRKTHGRLDALDAGDQYSDVRAVFSWSYQALNPPAARQFRLLGLHAGPDISISAAASLAGVPPAQARRQLAELVRAHLVTEWAPGRFELHDLLREYASELSETYDTAADRQVAVNRVLDHYLHTAYVADQLLRPRRDDLITLAPPQPLAIPETLTGYRDAVAWLATERQVLVAALRQAVSHGFDAHAWQLAWAVTSYLDRYGHWYDAASAHQAALKAAQRLGDRHAQAVMHGCLACACCRLEGYDAANKHLRQALELYESLGDQAGQAHAYRMLAWVLDRQSHYSEALPHAEQAVELFRIGGRPAGQARALNAVGWFHIQLGAPEEGLRQCRRALDIQREIDDRLGQADTLDSIARAHRFLAGYDQAIACYQQALHLYRESGDRYNEADTLQSLGDTYLAADDPGSAASAWQNALTILDELGLPEAGGLRAKLGKLARLTGDAIEHDRTRVASGT